MTNLLRPSLPIILAFFAACWAPTCCHAASTNNNITAGVLGAAPSRKLQQLPPGVAPEVGIIGAAIAALTPPLLELETPISARYTHYYDSLWWNCIAVYSTDFLDSLTGFRPTIVAPPNDQDLYTTPDRALCGAQAIATYNFQSCMWQWPVLHTILPMSKPCKMSV
jgi:hypothetical protein